MRPIQFKGCEHYSINAEGVVINTETNKVLKTDLNSCGYKRVTLWSKEQRRIRCTVHRLVAIHFLPTEEGKDMVNHIDGNKLNNHHSNLEWVTCRENTLHAFDKKLRRPHNSLPDEIVRAIRVDKREGILSRKEILEKYNISVHQFHDVKRNYKRVS